MGAVYTYYSHVNGMEDIMISLILGSVGINVTNEYIETLKGNFKEEVSVINSKMFQKIILMMHLTKIQMYL